MIFTFLCALEAQNIQYTWLLDACVFTIGNRAYAVTFISDSALVIQSGILEEQ